MQPLYCFIQSLIQDMILTPTHIDSSWGRRNGVSLLNIIMFCFCFIGLLEIVAEGKRYVHQEPYRSSKYPNKEANNYPSEEP